MKNKSSVLLLGCVVLAGCATGTKDDNVETVVYDTPTVDYVERLDVNNAPHQDSFLNQLAMNYRSYAIYNARTSDYPDIGELFAQKAVSAFSGETPFPETLGAWNIKNDNERFELYTAYNNLMGELKNDAVDVQPQLAAEAQAKFDCWLSAAASGQNTTAEGCKQRFLNTLQTLKDCKEGKVIAPTHVKSEIIVDKTETEEKYYPETRRLNAMSGTSRTREGVVIVNNVNIPSNLVQAIPVPQQTQNAQQPIVFNQNIYGGEGANDGDVPELGDEYVSRDEFINMMMAMRAELAKINKRLDDMGNVPAQTGDKTVIKVQQIPLEPKQHVMEEIFEIRFDFDKANIKPEYEDLIRKLATTTQANKNIKVSVVGHTDTAGTKDYNYALGGRRAEAVQKMLIKYGIPSSQIIAVSAGEEDLKVPTPNNTPNAANRRVRVVKEVHYTEQPKAAPIVVEEYTESDDCEDCNEE